MGETRSKSSKSKKSKKSKKAKKVKEVADPEPDVVDIDVPESDEENEVKGLETIEAPTSGIETIDAPESKRDLGSYFTVTPAEMPLLAYTVAALVFFFASVGKKCPDFEGIPGFRRRSLQFDDDLFDMIDDNFFDNYLEDLDNAFEDLDNAFEDALTSVNGVFGLGCLRTGYFAYALVFSIFGVLFGAGVLGWMKYNASLSESRNGLADAERDIEDGTVEEDLNKTVSEMFLDKHKKWIDLFLFAWATAGWAVFTFAGNGLFSTTGNGFFALWVMMLSSIWNLGVTADSITEQAKKSDTWIHALSLGSLVTIIELSTYLTGLFPMHKGPSGYGLFVSVTSLIFGLVVVIMSMVAPGKLDAKIKMYTLAGLLVLWIVAACLTTFVGPFLITGNGYFAVWGSVAFAGMALSGAQGEM